jgi:hypothetical protein
MDRGARTAARLRLVLVFIVVARWFEYQFVKKITFWVICTTVDIIKRSVDFSQKKYVRVARVFFSLTRDSCRTILLMLKTSLVLSTIKQHGIGHPHIFISPMIIYDCTEQYGDWHGTLLPLGFWLIIGTIA